MSEHGKIVALAGGVGGAKLAHGLYQALAPDMLTVVVNTADDFIHWGLKVSPDLDTVMYTLGGIANETTGWGVAGESWNALEAVAQYGGENWFRIGDKDLATHVLRTKALREGKRLSEVTADLAHALGIRAQLIPMTDDQVATMVRTPEGWLGFQDYFVRRHHRDTVLDIRIEGIEQAAAAPAVVPALTRARTIIFCPSNPIVSIGPILTVPGLKAAITASGAPRVAVSPIVGGKALRGPADTMLSALGHESSALGIARLYRGLVSGMVIDSVDAGLEPAIRALGLEVMVVDTVMHSVADRRRLAEATLAWCETLT